MRKLQLSIVLPFYNEKDSIALILNTYKTFSKDYNFELICVNNGSTDGSKKILDNFSRKKNFNFIKIVTVKKNKGYGHGIMSGVRNAAGEIIAWTHADMQTHPSDIFRAYDVYRKVGNNKTIIKGNRMGRTFVDVLVSMCMASIATVALRMPFYEINAQPKMFHRSLISQLAKAPDDFLLDLFLLYQANKLKYNIRTINVHFPKRAHGKSKWAYSVRSRLKMIARTLQYIYYLSSKSQL